MNIPTTMDARRPVMPSFSAADQASVQDAARKPQRGGFEAFIGRSRVMQNLTPVEAAEAVTGETPAAGFTAGEKANERTGFASKLRMPGEKA